MGRATILLALSASALPAALNSPKPSAACDHERKGEITVRKDISDAAFDWQTTRRPESAYRHSYHTMLVDSMVLCRKPNPKAGTPAQVILTFEQALERIRIIDNLTRGVPKIFYLVGWQYDGHDSKYPAWSEVNNRLKRQGDATAAESLRWLMKQARQFHSTVSLHINMMDAYQNSPLWSEYSDAGCILGKSHHGDNGGVWGGEQAYLIDYAREWECGLAQRRIDGLVASLPLQEAGTVHIDAFWPTGNPERTLPAMRRIVRYWRSLGIDVTTEGIIPGHPRDGLIGLCPMVWHLNVAEWGRRDEFTDRDYMAIPASLLCGARDHSRWSLAFGTSMHGEGIADGQWQEYLTRFCLNTLPWQYLNRQKRLDCRGTESGAEVRFSDGLVCKADFTNKTCRIEQGALLVRDGNDVFVPCPWTPTREIIAFSKDGCAEMRRVLPSAWAGVTSAVVGKITPDGIQEQHVVPIQDGEIQVSVPAGVALSIVAGQERATR